ncbi:MAG TPA: DHH family phosphoesterase [Usitatibacter sp.]|nr:DHH family phosphoesterase [Usitatibacter sp.]
MTHHDAFNGDADGICALHQLRLAEPRESVLVTGLKRDIALLERVRAAPGDEVTVLDVSLDRNRAALLRLLATGVRVRYFDHHYAGEIPAHPALEAHIDASGALCTSALVDRHLGGRFRVWAVVAAFGDNLEALALRLAAQAGLDRAPERLEALRELGLSLNYNAYGETELDQMMPAADLYRMVSGYADPFELLRHEPGIARLSEERHADLARARAVAPLRSLAGADAWLLPDEPWSRRVSGTFANRLASAEPGKVHAVLTARRDGYTVSVRTPRDCRPSAHEFCSRFASGGGRTGAAGIDLLPAGELDAFLDGFARAFDTSARP